MTEKTNTGWLAWAATISRHLTATVAAVAMIAGGAYWLFEPRIAEWLQSFAVGELIKEGGPCATIPEFGHFITGGRPGGQGSVEWRGVVRHRNDCGQPVVSGTIINGGGFYHDAPLSISGVALDVGTHQLKYLFMISDQAFPGAARFRVVVRYPDAVGGAPPEISPWLPFAIEAAD